jgi:hypothetical protein
MVVFVTQIHFNSGLENFEYQSKNREDTTKGLDEMLHRDVYFKLRAA